MSQVLHAELAPAAIFYQVHLFATRPDCRRNGYGADLLSLLEAHAKKRRKALCIEYNPAIKETNSFWVKHGYSETVNEQERAGLRRWYTQTPIWCKGSTAGRLRSQAAAAAPAPFLSLGYSGSGGAI